MYVLHHFLITPLIILSSHYHITLWCRHNFTYRPETLLLNFFVPRVQATSAKQLKISLPIFILTVYASVHVL